MQKQNTDEPDYREYFFNGFERGKYFAAAVLLSGGLAWFFYRDLRMSLFMLPIGILYLVKKRSELQKERQQQLALEFKDTILSVTASMQTGQSVENAFLEAEKDVGMIYGQNADMCRELARIRAGIKNNLPIEQQLLQLGARSGVDEIEEFTGIFATAKRSGGNLKEMIGRTAKMTEDKIEVKEEINVLLSERKYEQKVMMLIPFVLILYLQFTSPGFFDMLYHNPAGAAVMTGCLGVYLAAIYMAEKIMDISV